MLCKIWTVKALTQIYTKLFLDLDSACWKMLMESTMNLGEPSVFDLASA